MPNRILREGILTSEPVNRLSADCEVFYRRLMSVVDDFGRFTAHPSLLRASLYPLQLDKVREVSMERHLAECEKARLVRLYASGGKRYLELLKFNQHVRARASRFPQPPDQCNTDALHQSSIGKTDVPVVGDVFGDDTSSTTSDDVGARASPAGGEKTQPPDHPEPPNSDKPPDGFQRFWAAYPKKVGKVPAEKSWRTQCCESCSDAIISAVEREAGTLKWRKDKGEYIPHPTTWLNQRRWEDEGLDGFVLAPAIPKISSMSEQIAKAKAEMEAGGSSNGSHPN